MGTAMFTGVTGLLAFQRRLDVVANNIANVNTTGYRGSRVLFQDLFSQTLQGSTGPSGSFGGSNPMQVGLGVGIGSIDVNFNDGSLITTGFSTDLAIQGSGFFVLNDGSSDVFTRDGSFALNSNGLLIDPATGLFVQGFGVNAAGVVDTQSIPGDISIPVGGTAIVQATSVATLLGNLSSDATAGDTVTRTLRVFDSLGTEQDIVVTFTKRAQVTDGIAFNAWEYSASFNGTDVTNLPVGGVTGVLLFDNNGVFHDSGSVDVGDAFTAFPGTEVSIPAVLFTGPSIPLTSFDFDLDFAAITELSAASDVTLSAQDGFPRGILESFNVGLNGTINGVFTNGLTRVLGQVALASFSNVAGLERSGNNLFRESPGSGAAQVGVAGTGGRGDVAGGVLEGSNVDLATEFSNMIVTQRGFQANARTITAADTILQETVNLIR